jgi:hypothetical protein
MQGKRDKFKNELYHSTTEGTLMMRIETLSDKPKYKTLTDAWNK